MVISRIAVAVELTFCWPKARPLSLKKMGRARGRGGGVVLRSHWRLLVCNTREMTGLAGGGGMGGRHVRKREREGEGEMKEASRG